ncbi:MAG: competence/damage-inducible protein A [Bacteroidota bacterium]
MKAQIITIGDEILIGQIIDTNSAWMGEQLNLLGIKVDSILTVSDEYETIQSAVGDADGDVDVVLITGGLGPTKDDVTKKAIADYFETPLLFHEETYDRIVHAFKVRNIPLTDHHREQCHLPEACIILKNNRGTAPGMWFESKSTVFVSMPGVPHEMKNIMQYQVIPRLQKKNNTQEIAHRTILTAGIGETSLANIISDFEAGLPSNIKLAYLPGLGQVRLRLSGFGSKANEIAEVLDRKADEMYNLVAKYAYGREKENLETVLGEMLKERGALLATAESCTGGHIGHTITSVPGSSEYFAGGVIAYSNSVKMNQLRVSPDTLETHGAVSRHTVEEMVKGVVKLLHVDYGIAVSGIAGPGGGSDDKPVGLVCIAVGTQNKVISREFRFGKERLTNIKRTTITALNMMRKFLLADKLE